MVIQFTTSEIEELKENLTQYAPAQEALTNLEAQNGDAEACFNHLWEKHNKQPVPIMAEGKSLWEVTLNVLKDELCGDDGFKAKAKQYLDNPKKTNAFSALVGYVVGLTAFEAMPVTIVTIAVIYILKVGLKIFCEYTSNN